MSGINNVPDNLIHFHWMLLKFLDIPLTQITWSTGCCPDVYTSPHHWPPDPQDVAQMSGHPYITDNQIHRMLPRCLHITSLTNRSTGCCPDLWNPPHHRQPDPWDVAQMSAHPHITDNLIHRMLPRCLNTPTSQATWSTGCCPDTSTSQITWSMGCCPGSQSMQLKLK